MRLDELKDPKLRTRIEKAMSSVELVKKDMAVICPKPKKRIRQDTKPLLNKLEQDYYDQCLKCISAYVTKQAIRFRLANGLWYKSDFVVWWPRGPQAIEVKGPYAYRGGFENLKMAATSYPFIEWALVWKEGDDWRSQVVLP